MLVRRHARQSFQHFVAGDLESGGAAIGQEGAPDRMRVQDGAGTARVDDGVVQPRLRGGSARAGQNDTGLIELENIVWRELAFVRAAAGDREAQWITRDHRAEVPARAEPPSTRVKAVAGLNDLADQRHELRRCGQRGAPPFPPSFLTSADGGGVTSRSGSIAFVRPPCPSSTTSMRYLNPPQGSCDVPNPVDLTRTFLLTSTSSLVTSITCVVTEIGSASPPFGRIVNVSNVTFTFLVLSFTTTHTTRSPGWQSMGAFPASIVSLSSMWMRATQVVASARAAPAPDSSNTEMHTRRNIVIEGSSPVPS